MSFHMNLGDWNSVFAVPASVVDSHMRLAGAVQLKVLLWSLRHAGEDFTMEDLACAVGATPADTRDAMQYWVETGLIRQTGERFTPPGQEAPEEVSPASEKNVEAPAEAHHASLVSTLPPPASGKEHEPSPEPAKMAAHRIPKPDGVFISQRINESKEVSFLMQEAQLILGRPISPGLSSCLLFIHDDYGLPVDVIVMLLQYVKNKGRDNTNYIESVAKGWAADGVFSHEAAEQKLRQLDESEQAWRKIENALHIPHRSPSQREEQFARRWIMEWKFSDEMIREAYDRCVDSTGRMNLSYVNRILERWQKAGVRTPQAAAAEQNLKTTARSQQKETSFDLDEYERTSDWRLFGKE
jgi:DnaD/phage-associated family protein